MKVAVLGWGSLLWEPTPQGIAPATVGPWHKWGPSLPIEFARVSSSRAGALTLVVVPGPSPPRVAHQRTVWALSPKTDLESAIYRLKTREGCPLEKIHALPDAGVHSKAVPPSIEELVKEWLRGHPEFDHVIWTGLESNWNIHDGPGAKYGPFSAEAGMEYLLTELRPESEGRKKAEEYIRRAPSWIDTNLRRKAITKGWIPLPLPKDCEIV